MAANRGNPIPHHQSQERKRELLQIASIWGMKERISVQFVDAIQEAGRRIESDTASLEPRVSLPFLAEVLDHIRRFFLEFVCPLYKLSRAHPEAFQEFCKTRWKKRAHRDSPSWWVEQYGKVHKRPPVPIEKLLSRAARLTRKLGRKMASDQIAADVGIILSPTLDPSLREIAAARLSKHIGGRPIPMRRWNARRQQFRSAIEGLASRYGTSAKAVVEDEIGRAVFLIAPALAFSIFIEDQESFRALRRLVSRSATESLLGPGWREQFVRGTKKHVAATRPDPLAEVETRLQIARLIGKAHLTNRQAQVVGEILKGNSVAAVAKRLGIAPSTARVLCHRALKELQRRAKKIA